MRLELRHLRLIQAVAEEETLTRAGKRLFLTQSALSHQLRSIEAQLGTQVFRRQNRRMVLTPVGERLLRAARVIRAELDGAEAEIRAHLQGEAGRIRLSTECYTCYHWIPEILKRFSERYPRVEVRLEVDATERPVEALVEGRLDLAVVTTPVDRPGIRVLPLFQDEFVAIAAPAHPWAGRAHVEAEDFREEHLITYTLPTRELTLFRQLLEPAGIVPRRVTRIQLTEAIIEFVRAGLGVSALPRWVVRPYLESGALASARLTARGLRRPWWAAIAADAPPPPSLLALIELIAAGEVGEAT